jgi:hypothetical protein
MGILHERPVVSPGLSKLLGAQPGDHLVEHPGEMAGQAQQLGADIVALEEVRTVSSEWQLGGRNADLAVSAKGHAISIRVSGLNPAEVGGSETTRQRCYGGSLPSGSMWYYLLVR